VISLIAICFLWKGLTEISRRDSTAPKLMRSLVASLAAYKSGTVYVLNAPNSYSNPSDIAALANSQARLVVLNEFRGCKTGSSYKTTAVKDGDRAVHITSVLPECAKYKFEQVPYPTLSPGFEGVLQRGEFATYHFPEAHPAEYRVMTPKLGVVVDLGKEMDITLTPEGDENYTILYYDWSVAQYKPLSNLAGLNSATVPFPASEKQR
jgi:hypothetical protein